MLSIVDERRHTDVGDQPDRADHAEGDPAVGELSPALQAPIAIGKRIVEEEIARHRGERGGDLARDEAGAERDVEERQHAHVNDDAKQPDG